ncbi:MAG: ZIP family metal transporter [Patescibacteria group bacterium]|nr:ZIP family metal transporter [Patescibacteria group bacterium]
MSIVYLYTFASVFIISIISLVGIVTLSMKERLLHKVLFVLVSVATGALFGDALIHLIPESFKESNNAVSVSLFILLGIVSFFVLEKFLRWKHVHTVENGVGEEIHAEALAHENAPIAPLGHLVLVSDGVHNFIDGVIIGSSYLISIEVGIATTIAIVLHEIPQEISDFGVLLHAGFSKNKAIFMNFLSALTAIVGAGMALFIGSSIDSLLPMIAAFAAGSFLYIAGSDLVPEIHKVSDPRRSMVQFAAILFGIGIMFLLLFVEL